MYNHGDVNLLQYIFEQEPTKTKTKSYPAISDMKQLVELIECFVMKEFKCMYRTSICTII